MKKKVIFFFLNDISNFNHTIQAQAFFCMKTENSTNSLYRVLGHTREQQI
jgi:hypothetical protein